MKTYRRKIVVTKDVLYYAKETETRIIKDVINSLIHEIPLEDLMKLFNIVKLEGGSELHNKLKSSIHRTPSDLALLNILDDLHGRMIVQFEATINI